MSRRDENAFEDLVSAWCRSCDAAVDAASRALESSLTSKEFLEMSRRSLELWCGHRDRLAAAAAEFSTPVKIPARPETTRKTKKRNGRPRR